MDYEGLVGGVTQLITLTTDMIEVLISCSKAPLTSRLTLASEGGIELYNRERGGLALSHYTT